MSAGRKAKSVVETLVLFVVLLAAAATTTTAVVLLLLLCVLLNLVLLEHHRLVMSRRCFAGLSRVSLRSTGVRLPLLARALTAQRTQTRRKHSSSGKSSSGDHDARESTTTTTSTSSTPNASEVGRQPTKKTDLSGLKHQVEHRATETIGIRLTERVVERIAEAAELRAEKAAASRTLSAVAKRAGSRAATATMRPAAAAAPRGILGSLPVRTAVARVGRGFLIALPLAGAGFAAWIGRSDYRRTRQELELARARLSLAEAKHNEDVDSGREAGAAASRPTLDTAAVRCFGVATAADSVNVVAHLVAVYGLYQGWAPEGIVNAESVGLVSAVVSTGGAVRGEYLAACVGNGRQHDGAGDGAAAGSFPKEHAAGGVRRDDKTGGGDQ